MNDESRVRIGSESDIVTVRKTVRQLATTAGFGITDLTRVVTAASELARNVFHYAGKGTMEWRLLENGDRVGIELTFEDQGPGIADIEQAMQEGYSTSGGLGMGLPGTKRLMDEMDVQSTLGQGTRVKVRKWRRK